MMKMTHPEIYGRFLRDLEAALSNKVSASPNWLERCRCIRADALARSAFDFLRWPSLDIFSVPESWVPTECYEELRRDREWRRRWQRATRETKIGSPKDWRLDFGTSPALVQHAYHLLRYERATSRSLLDCDVIFEIGGGYGSFCRLLRNEGFQGLHIIYDLPEVSCVQRLFLALSGFPELARDELVPGRSNGFHLATADGLDDLHDLLTSRPVEVGFVATWSLSETPIDVRTRLFPRFHAIFSNYLLAFQPSWEDIDNTDYFKAFQQARPDLAWRTLDMPRIVVPPSNYLFA